MTKMDQHNCFILVATFAVILLLPNSQEVLAAPYDHDMLLVNAWTAAASISPSIGDSVAMDELYAHATPRHQFNGEIKRLLSREDHEWPKGSQNNGDFQATIDNFTSNKNNQRIKINALQRACYIPDPGDLARTAYKATIVSSWPRVVDSVGQESVMLPYAKSWVFPLLNDTLVYYTMEAHCWEGNSMIGKGLNASMAQIVHDSDVELKQVWQSQTKRIGVSFKGSLLLIDINEWYNVWEMDQWGYETVLTSEDANSTLGDAGHKRPRVVPSKMSTMLHSIPKEGFSQKGPATQAIFNLSCAQEPSDKTCPTLCKYNSWMDVRNCTALAFERGRTNDTAAFQTALLSLSWSLGNWKRWQKKKQLRHPPIPAFLSPAYGGCTKYQSYQGSCILADPRKNQSGLGEHFASSNPVSRSKRWKLWKQLFSSITLRNRNYASFYDEIERSIARIKGEFDGHVLNNIHDWGFHNYKNDTGVGDQRAHLQVNKTLPALMLSNDPTQANTVYENKPVTFFDWRVRRADLFDTSVGDPWNTQGMLRLRRKALADIQTAVQVKLNDRRFANAPCEDIASAIELWLLFFAAIAAGIGGMEGSARTLDKSYTALRKWMHRKRRSWIYVPALVTIIWTLVAAPIIALGIQVGRDIRARSYSVESERVVVTASDSSTLGPGDVQYGHRNALSTVILVTSECSRNNFALGLALLITSILLTVILNVKLIVFTFKLVWVGLRWLSSRCCVPWSGHDKQEFEKLFHHDPAQDINPLLHSGFVPDPEIWSQGQPVTPRSSPNPGNSELSPAKTDLGSTEAGSSPDRVFHII